MNDFQTPHTLRYLHHTCVYFRFFFFQAEDGIRDDLVTGVQTCALPISSPVHLETSLPAPNLICWKFALVPRFVRFARRVLCSTTCWMNWRCGVSTPETRGFGCRVGATARQLKENKCGICSF